MAGYVLAVRPQPGLAATIATAEKMGLNAIGYPLFEICLLYTSDAADE